MRISFIFFRMNRGDKKNRVVREINNPVKIKIGASMSLFNAVTPFISE